MKKLLSVVLVLMLLCSTALADIDISGIGGISIGDLHPTDTPSIVLHEECEHESIIWVDRGDGTCSRACLDCGIVFPERFPHSRYCDAVNCAYCGAYCPDAETSHNLDITHDDCYCWLFCTVCSEIFDKTSHNFDASNVCIYCGYANQVIESLKLGKEYVDVTLADAEGNVVSFAESGRSDINGDGFYMTVQDKVIDGITLTLTKAAVDQLNAAEIKFISVLNYNWKVKKTFKLEDITAALADASEDGFVTIDVMTGEMTVGPVAEEEPAAEEAAATTEEPAATVEEPAVTVEEPSASVEVI